MVNWIKTPLTIYLFIATQVACPQIHTFLIYLLGFIAAFIYSSLKSFDVGLSLLLSFNNFVHLCYKLPDNFDVLMFFSFFQMCRSFLTLVSRTEAYQSSILLYKPNSSHVVYREPVPVPRTNANCELCDYEHANIPHSLIVSLEFI